MTTRIESLRRDFSARFGGEGTLFRAGGRTEIGGNHTDHQHGRVLCAGVDLDMLSCAAPNGLPLIRVHSDGYGDVEVDLSDLSPRAGEVNTTAALVRGVAAGIAARGYTVGGLDICIISDVPPGSGLSSSAAFEVLMGAMVNHVFCADALSPVELAKIGQQAENRYFGKPCGLMDQMACAVGGVVAIDFADPANPVVRRVEFDFSACGHALCIVDTGSCHADLTDDYAGIPRDMGAVAAWFGKTVLRQVDEGDFRANLPALRRDCGDRAVLRAIHFYEDDRRAAQEAEALEAGDFTRFLALVNESGLSSQLNLQNAYSPAHPEQQAIPMALARGRELLGDSGAIRVHGGGFAGTVQAFVPNEKLSEFKQGMEALLGQGACRTLHICPTGAGVIQ